MPELGYIDPNAEQRKADFERIPDGWYPAQLIEADVVATKDGTGQRLPYKVEIIEGKYAGRKVNMINGMNIVNRSAEAQRIGQSELRQLSEACGYAWPLPANANSDIFLFKPLEVRLGAQKDKPQYNEVKAFRRYGSAQAGTAQQGQPQQQVQPQPQPQPPLGLADGAEAAAGAGRSAAGGSSRPWR